MLQERKKLEWMHDRVHDGLQWNIFVGIKMWNQKTVKIKKIEIKWISIWNKSVITQQANNIGDMSFVTKIGTRISGPEHAANLIGQICVYNSKGMCEYGRIVRPTTTVMCIERMTQTLNGEFIPHPISQNRTTRNSLKYSRDIRLISTIPL